MIADNRLTEIGTWDDQLLAQQFKELSLLDLDFTLEADRLRDGRDRSAHRGARELQAEPTTTPPMSCPRLPARPAGSRPVICGILGQHRVLCGKRADAAAYTPADGRGTGRNGLYRSALQPADRRQRQRSRFDPSSRLRYGLGEMDRAEIHDLSQPGRARYARAQRRRLARTSSAWTGDTCRRADGRRPRSLCASSRISACG